MTGSYAIKANFINKEFPRFIKLNADIYDVRYD
jgi:hypothetical protein